MNIIYHYAILWFHISFRRRHPRPRIRDRIENCPAALSLSLSLSLWIALTASASASDRPPPSGTASPLSTRPPGPRPFFLYSLSPLAFHLPLSSLSLPSIYHTVPALRRHFCYFFCMSWLLFVISHSSFVAIVIDNISLSRAHH
jgi:hypothetical protein